MEQSASSLKEKDPKYFPHTERKSQRTAKRGVFVFERSVISHYIFS